VLSLVNWFLAGMMITKVLKLWCYKKTCRYVYNIHVKNENKQILRILAAYTAWSIVCNLSESKLFIVYLCNLSVTFFNIFSTFNCKRFV